MKRTFSALLLLVSSAAGASETCPAPLNFTPVNPVASLPDALSERLIPADIRLINIWAVWCAPCRKELPMLAALHAQLAPQSTVSVQALHVGASGDAIENMLAQHGAEGLGDSYVEDMTLLKPLGIYGLPTTLLEVNGEVRYLANGFLGEDAAPLKDWLTCLGNQKQ